MKKVIFFIFLIQNSVFGQNATLDTSFGTAGFVGTPNTTEIIKVGLLSDDKIISVGYRNGTLYYRLLLTKNNPNGTPDSTFGINGISEAIIGYTDFPNAISIQPDDKILVGGRYNNNSMTEISTGNGAFLARFLSNGSFDTSFGVNGVIKTNTVVSTNTIVNITAVGLLSNHKIIALGSHYNNSNATLLKFNPDGSYDTSFGVNGVKIINFPGITTVIISDIKILSDNSILCYGNQYASDGSQSLIIVKYNEDGTINTSFANNGIKIIATSQISFEYGTKMHVNNDGTLLVFSYNSTQNSFIKLLPNGDFDPTFGTNGIASTGDNFAHDFEVLPNGKIIIGSQRSLITYVYVVDANFAFTAKMYNADGTPDQLFSAPHNCFDIDPGPFNDYLSSIKLQNDGKLLMGGSSRIGGNTLNANFSLVRINLNQSLDNQSFTGNTIPILYPNPNDGSFKISANAIYSIKIYDTVGQLVFSKINGQDENDIKTNLKNGIYLLKIESATGKVMHTKMVVQ